MHAARCLLLLVSTIVAQPDALRAQPVSPSAGVPTADVPITVVGVRQSPAVIHQHAVDFVHATGVAAGEMPAARWAAAVCPRAVGLNDVPAQIVEAKLRSIAADAGIPAARLPCTTNIAIVFTTDGAATVRDIAARAPRRMGGLRPAAVSALTNGSAPIRWWYASEVRDKDGIAASSSEYPARQSSPGEQSGSGLSGNEDTTFLQHYNTSLISTEDVRVLRAATVVVDMTRTDGLPLSAVASYAAMVAFAEIRPGATPPDSVLGLFTGGPIERSPTAWDTAFLRALYRLPLDREARRQRGRLVADLVTAARP